MKHLFIINPAAGKGKTLKLIPEINKIFKDRKEEYAIEVTNKVGHATEIARNYSGREAYRIYSVGGDGTLNEVLNGMANTNSSLAVIPSGSGNDFIKNIYKYSKHEKTEDILIKTINGKEEYVDLGVVNNRYFLNISSAGFDAEVAYNSLKLRKLPLISGKLAYLLAIIITAFKYNSIEVNIQIDDNEIRTKALLLAVANGEYYGGGINVAPEAHIDDGLFDICVIDDVSKFKILTLFPKVIKGSHSEIKEVNFYRGKKVKITCGKTISFNIDGEITRGNSAEFNIIRNGVKIVIPQNEK